MQSNTVRVLSLLKLVFLKQFLILQMTVLSLDRIQLVSQSQVVLVSLLYFEDLCFELANKQIFLVTCKVNTIVVLKE
jgi:hypothetical protein